MFSLGHFMYIFFSVHLEFCFWMFYIFEAGNLLVVHVLNFTTHCTQKTLDLAGSFRVEDQVSEGSCFYSGHSLETALDT